mmetsp:Transcript_49221/g.107318  ORF Transcript_49221/g.107318 Transcript_49221/m.107318 type:complete len:204 (+) Transcript_49221:1790-2401(+)
MRLWPPIFHQPAGSCPQLGALRHVPGYLEQSSTPWGHPRGRIPAPFPECRALRTPPPRRRIPVGQPATRVSLQSHRPLKQDGCGDRSWVATSQVCNSAPLCPRRSAGRAPASTAQDLPTCIAPIDRVNMMVSAAASQPGLAAGAEPASPDWLVLARRSRWRRWHWKRTGWRLPGRGRCQCREEREVRQNCPMAPRSPHVLPET